MDFTPHTETEIAEMLEVIGVSSIDNFSALSQKDLRCRIRLSCLNR